MNPRVATLAALVACCACSPMLTAQRTDVDFKWKKSQIVVSFNPVSFGKHSLEELPVGREWRMGMNTASTLSTDVPLVGATGVVAPGSYRVSIRRTSEREFGLQVASAELATSGSQAWFPTTLEDAKKVDKLELQWQKGTTKKSNASAKKSKANGGDTEAAPVDPVDGKHAQRATLRLSFGPYRLDMGIAMVGAKSAKVRGFKSDAFEWPAKLFQDQVTKGHVVPILTLRTKGSSKSPGTAFNLLIDDKKAEIYPAMIAPTGSFGFAGVNGFDAADILRGTIQWSDSKTEQPFLQVSGIDVKNKQLKLTVAVGKRVASITVPVPK